MVGAGLPNDACCTWTMRILGFQTRVQLGSIRRSRTERISSLGRFGAYKGLSPLLQICPKEYGRRCSPAALALRVLHT